MVYPNFTVAGLAEFSGRPEASYGAYATQALKQASLLFKKSTCLDEFPTDPDDNEMASNAIYELADYFVLSQPFQKILAAPFSSESIGSYSYSKMVNKINRREKTNLLWWDMAVEELGQCDWMGGSFSSGGIEAFEFDNVRVRRANGNTRLIGPAESYPELGPLDTSDFVTGGDPNDDYVDGGQP